MYCPRCGQQQASRMLVSHAVRFSLGPVKELLVAGNASKWSLKRSLGRDVEKVKNRIQADVFGLMLLPVAFALAFAFDEPGPFCRARYFF